MSLIYNDLACTRCYVNR